MSELKNCPFCGSDDLSVHFDDGFSYYVWCGHCGSQTDNDHLTEKEAIKAWNTRPAEDALKAENERLKNKLALVKKHIVDNRDALLFVLKSEHDSATYCEFAFCQSLIELINTDTGKGGEDE